MKNSANARYKLSKLENSTNTSILCVFAVQLVLALIGGFLGSEWMIKERDNVFYLGSLGSDSKFVLLIQFTGTWILIMTNFVPISLMVTLELVKFWQGMFMGTDYQLYDPDQDMEMRAQSSNLNEELGQVEYVFSDKTGTLTCNIMEFKKFSAGSGNYGTGQKPEEKQESNVCFHDPAMFECLNDPKADKHEELKRTMVFLAACHTIIIDERKGTYNAASPDELALVNAAKQFGYEFKGFDAQDRMIIHNKVDNETIRFELLNVCEFSSSRKRMSVILRDEQGQIRLMCKGADSVIKDRLSSDSVNSSVFEST
mmetsp:Transcript_3850/g.5829  ORF Transcript_3850/g.5829 Transcript_3850/m.5829 type:complete len:313 (+) Transcript_3850:681-1619(+)